MRREIPVAGACRAWSASFDAVFAGRFDLICAAYGSFPVLLTDSSRCRQKLRDAHEIVGDRGEHEEPFHLAAAAMAGFAQSADRLHPAEAFFDPFALDRADAIAG